MKPTPERRSLRQRYLDFCERGEKQRALWFIVPLMTLAAVVMPPSILLMFYFPSVLTAFITASIVLFFINIILSIAEQPPRVTISFFLFTVLFYIFAPLICSIVSLFSGGTN